MKRILLSLSAVLIGVAAQAQSSSEAVIKHQNGTALPSPTRISVPANGKAIKKVRGAGNASTVVGTTYYDLQTNASMSRRIVNHGGGKVSAVWTMSKTSDPATGAFSDRGTGYNYNNGTAWGPNPATRIEAVRCGFTNILSQGGVEHIFSHNATSRASFGYKNTAIGSTGFSLYKTLNGALTQDTIIWPKSAAAGNDIYVIGTNSYAYDSMTTNMYYSYSPDGGLNWPLQCVQLPGLSKNQMFETSADGYNIDASGNTVAMVVGEFPNNMYLLTSTNKGTTWAVDTILDNGLMYGVDPLHQSTFIGTDSLVYGSDGSAGVYVAADGTVHLTFSPVAWLLDSAGAADNIANNTRAYSYYPLRNNYGLFHISRSPAGTLSAMTRLDGLTDCDGDSTFALGANHNLTGNTSKSARYNSFNPTNFSQMAGSGDTVFVVYSVIMDADSTEAGGASPIAGQNFRDIFINVSPDKGVTWGDRVNISNTPGVEDVFPSIARMVDGKVHVLWQSDNEPGCVLTNGDDQDAGNDIRYLAIDRNWIHQHSASGDYSCYNGDFVAIGINEVDKFGKTLYTVTPNPASTVITVKGPIDNNTVKVYNTIGQEMKVAVARINATEVKLTVADLPAGVYNVQIGNSKNASSTKFVKD